MLLVPLHERIRRLNNEDLLTTSIEHIDDATLMTAIDDELDRRSLLAHPARLHPAPHTQPKRLSLLRWLDPDTRPTLPENHKKPRRSA